MPGMPTTEPADPVALWTGHDFHREAEAWVREVLASRGVAPTGGWEQPHARPWSSAIRFETTWRPVWFKVNGAGTRQEPALLRMLAEAAPPPLAWVITDALLAWAHGIGCTV